MFRWCEEAKKFVGLIIDESGSYGGKGKEKFMQFDPYYCFALIGLAACERDTLKENEMIDIIRYYPGQYKEKKSLIAGILISSEAERRGIATDNPKLESVMLEYLSDDDTMLTEEGRKALNAYSKKGFNIYRDYFPGEPQSREEFLQCFYKVISMYNKSS